MALAPWASAATSDFTTTNSVTSTLNNAWFNGFRISLNPHLENTRLATTSTNAELGIDDYEEVGLTSITANIRSLHGRTGIKLALTDSSGGVITLSDNTVTATGNQTWNFSDTRISTTDDLYFVYVDASNEAIEAGYALQFGNDNDDGDVVRAGGLTVANYGNTSGCSSLTMLGGGGAGEINMSFNNVNFAPKLTIETAALYDIWMSEDGTWSEVEGEGILFDGRGNSTVLISEEGATAGWVRVSKKEEHDVQAYALTGGALNTEALGVENGHLTIGNHTVVSGETSVDPGAKLTILGGGYFGDGFAAGGFSDGHGGDTCSGGGAGG